MKTLGLILAVALIFSCASNGQIKIEDASAHKTLAYGAGHVMGLGITKKAPEADPIISEAWGRLMERSHGLEFVPTTEMLIFYNDLIGILSIYAKDPYGLVAGLGVLLMIFGAEFNEDGDMVKIEPVPMVILQFAEMGYRNGRMVAEND